MVKEIRPVTGSIETVDAAAEPTVPSARAEVFYAQALRERQRLKQRAVPADHAIFT